MVKVDKLTKGEQIAQIGRLKKFDKKTQIIYRYCRLLQSLKWEFHMVY